LLDDCGMNAQVSLDVFRERHVEAAQRAAFEEFVLEPVLGLGLRPKELRPDALPARLAPAGLPAVLALARPALCLAGIVRLLLGAREFDYAKTRSYSSSFQPRENL
jgi:hypothetical protein